MILPAASIIFGVAICLLSAKATQILCSYQRENIEFFSGASVISLCFVVGWSFIGGGLYSIAGIPWG